MYGPTPFMRAPARVLRPPAPSEANRAGTPRYAFLELTFGHLDPNASAIAEHGARYVPVAHELGRLLLEQQAEVAHAVAQGATLELSETTPVYLDDVAGFDHVAIHLRLHGSEPVLFRLDTFFYRGDRVVATTEQRGQLTTRVHEASAWLP
jgi:hypothetical protein